MAMAITTMTMITRTAEDGHGDIDGVAHTDDDEAAADAQERD